MKHITTCCLFALLSATLCGQTKKTIEHEDVHRWKKIDQKRLSNNGQWAVWTQVPVTEGDSELHLWDANTGKTRVFPRALEPQFSEDSKWLAFRIKPALDSLKSLRRKKVKDEDLPKDTLGLLELSTGNLEKIPRLKNFALAEKWNEYLAFQCEPEKPLPAKKESAETQPDSLKTATEAPKTASKSPAGKEKKPKKEDKDNGYRLIIRNLRTQNHDTIAYVKSYILAKKGPRILLHATGKGDTMTFAANPRVLQNGLYVLNLEQYSLRPIIRTKGDFQQLAMDEYGAQAAFLADLDTSKARIRPWQLGYWEPEQDSALFVAGPGSSFLPAFQPTPHQPANAWGISEHARPVFSEDGTKLYFGIAPPPVLNDTTLLKEEIVEVEVWSWQDQRMYTQEKNRLDREKKRAHSVVYYPRSYRFVPIGSPDLPELRFQEQRNASLALGINEEPYAQFVTTEGTAYKDLYAVNLETGAKKQIVQSLRCNPRISPAARYIAWWSDPDSSWFAWNARTSTIARLTTNQPTPFFNEEHDVPDYPGESGLADWLDGDEAMLAYDQYDIWKIDPEGKKKPIRLTQGRESKIRYRYLKLDPEQRSIPANARILLHQFNTLSKAETYVWLDLGKAPDNSAFADMPASEEGGDHAYARSPLKAKNADVLLFTKENYQNFPNLYYWNYSGAKKQKMGQSDAQTNAIQRISDANPQQSEYNWGSIEMLDWVSLTGERIRGLLVKPEDFDPSIQYPMIVNFYEKLSDNLHSHRSPDFHRSQINYTVYASRGYLVFAPDIAYRIGYPGESAYDAIMSGVTALLAEGYVDSKRIALQGHSWGGYQAAYLVTRTNLFVCAEAGAPVANMTSAYGGIRWESGLSRVFQYERQQSRIGGTLWEKPKQYIENSPLFALDKVETPLLILHNDKDGAVPWYQGIELFSGLRRLGKPAWMLNYNDEPHWPVKLQNRIDFQRRMQQFFDHYLLGTEQPAWMRRGVPPIEKGILQGY